MITCKSCGKVSKYDWYIDGYCMECLHYSPDRAEMENILSYLQILETGQEWGYFKTEQQYQNCLESVAFLVYNCSESVYEILRSWALQEKDILNILGLL